MNEATAFAAAGAAVCKDGSALEGMVAVGQPPCGATSGRGDSSEDGVAAPDDMVAGDVPRYSN